MTCNVGGVDRAVRVLVGVILTPVAMFLFPGMVSKVALLTLALLSFVSAWYGFCFINKFLGINTAKTVAVPTKS